MLLKGCKLLCLPINPHLPPTAASLVSDFLVINSMFPDHGGQSLNLPSVSRDRQSITAHLPVGARGAGRGSSDYRLGFRALS